MSDTPRTDKDTHRYENASVEWIGEWVPACACRIIERELNAANQRIMRLHDGILKNNQEIEQTCGKVLGYPWFKDDQKNFPGSTENDGVCVGEHVAETIVSELASRYTEALARIKRLEEESESRWMLAQSAIGSCAEMSSRIKRLEEAGDRMYWTLDAEETGSVGKAMWNKAKEAKP